MVVCVLPLDIFNCIPCTNILFGGLDLFCSFFFFFFFLCKSKSVFWKHEILLAWLWENANTVKIAAPFLHLLYAYVWSAQFISFFAFQCGCYAVCIALWYHASICICFACFMLSNSFGNIDQLMHLMTIVTFVCTHIVVDKVLNGWTEELSSELQDV